jgi:hypothetical protein
MMPRGSALVMLLVGVLLALVSVFADALGIGGEPGFGYKQSAGLVAGLVLVGVSLWRWR